MNTADMQARSIAPGALVEIKSLADDGKRRVVRAFRVKPQFQPERTPYRPTRGSYR